MSLRTGIATVCLSGTLPDKLAAAAHAGFDGVELFEPDVLGTPMSPDEIRQLCAELGLSIDLYQPFRDVEGAPAERFEITLRRARRVFATMQELGCDLVLICSSTAPDTIDDDELAAAQLRQLAELAQEHGLRICYEALAWGIHVSTWEHSWRIVERADHPALGICLDSFHVLSRTREFSGIAELPGERIFFLQLADAPKMDMNVLQWSRHYRLFPGQGAFDVVGFTRAVLEAGYSGPLSLEVFNDVFRQSPPALTAADAHRSLTNLEAALGPVPTGSGPHGSAMQSSDMHSSETSRSHTRGAEARLLPAAPSPGTFAFVEIEATPSSALQLRSVLRSLGFTWTRTHRTKPVTLWEQGDARLLLTITAHPDTSGPHTRIAAIGLDTSDVDAAAARLRALDAELLPRVVSEQETAMPAIASPDGTGVFFCPTRGGAGGQGWLDDFLRTDERANTGQPDAAGSTEASLTNVDHVSLTQPFDRFDESILLFRSLLDTSAPASAEHAGPFGLVRSQEFSPQDGLRLVLNASVLRRGSWSPGVLSPQHIALRTEDVVQAADRMHAAGAPVLHISPNYYADLAARLGLYEDFVESLRSRNLLYERDGEGGECLHFFTPVLGSQVYFEVVEYRGGFSGFGTADTPIRMASHAAQRRAALLSHT